MRWTLVALALLTPSAVDQEKSASPVPFVQILECVGASTCKNMTRGRVRWADMVGSGLVFDDSGWKYGLALSGPKDKPRELTILLTPRWPYDGTHGDEFKPFWQKQADQALAAIRRQMSKPDSMSVLDYPGTPNTLHGTLQRTPVVVVGEVAAVSDPRVGAAEDAVHREVQIQISELLRDVDRQLTGRNSLVVAQYGGMAEAGGKLRATIEVLTPRSLQKGDWVALFLGARKDGLFNLVFGQSSVIWLGEPGRDWTVTLPGSFSQMTELARAQIPQSEFLDILRKTSGQLRDVHSKPELPVPAQEKPTLSIADIRACALKFACANMKRSSVNWYDQVGIPVVEFSEDGQRYALRNNDRSGELAIFVTLKGDSRPSRLLNVGNDGKVILGELFAIPPGGGWPRRLTPEERAKWYQDAKILSPAMGTRGAVGEEYRTFWQELADQALAAIRRTISR